MAIKKRTKRKPVKAKSRKVPTKATKKLNVNKTDELIKQLKKAGAVITATTSTMPGKKLTLKQLSKESRISKSMIDAIKTSDVDFTAWGAWTLRF